MWSLLSCVSSLYIYICIYIYSSLQMSVMIRFAFLSPLHYKLCKGAMGSLHLWISIQEQTASSSRTDNSKMIFHKNLLNGQMDGRKEVWTSQPVKVLGLTLPPTCCVTLSNLLAFSGFSHMSKWRWLLVDRQVLCSNNLYFQHATKFLSHVASKQRFITLVWS